MQKTRVIALFCAAVLTAGLMSACGNTDTPTGGSPSPSQTIATEPSAAPSAEPSTAPSAEASPTASADASSPEITTAPPQETQAAGTPLTLAEGSTVQFPGEPTGKSLEERVSLTKDKDATMDTYTYAMGDVSLAALRVYTDGALFEDPNSADAKAAVQECLKTTIYPTIYLLLPDVQFVPKFEEAQVEEKTYTTASGATLPMYTIQTQDAYVLNTIVSAKGIYTVVGFTPGEKAPVNSFLDSLTIAE